jgi:hypothetical protein
MSRFIPNLGQTETEIDLPQFINVVDMQSGGRPNEDSSPVLSLTSSMVGGNGNALSMTSTILPMAGGNGLSATSSARPSADTSNINKLVSMLTSESDGAMSNTDTEQLEGQLKGILQQNGGSRTRNSFGLEPNQVKQFFSQLKNEGVEVKLRLNHQSFDEFFGLNSTEAFDMEGGNNPGFKAFLALKKYISEKLGVSNGPIAAKVAGAVQRETKEKNPDVKDGVKIADLAKEMFEKNMDKYKAMV